MTQTIRLFLFCEGAAFIVAALIHGGVLLSGYEHREARIAESAIAAVLFAGLMLTYIRPGSTRMFGLAAQGFALFWTLVGIFTIVIGVGPRTLADIAYHITIVIVLACGLTITKRSRFITTSA